MAEIKIAIFFTFLKRDNNWFLINFYLLSCNRKIIHFISKNILRTVLIKVKGSNVNQYNAQSNSTVSIMNITRSFIEIKKPKMSQIS